MFTSPDEVLCFMNSHHALTDEYGAFTDARLLNSLCNYVWKVSTDDQPNQPSKALIVKQYDGVVRSAPSVALSTQRAFVEWSGLNAAHTLSASIKSCLWSVPRPILYDSAKNLIVMEFVNGSSLFEFLSKDTEAQAADDSQQHQRRQDQLDWITNAVVAFVHDLAGLQLDPSILRASSETNPVFEYMEDRKTEAHLLFDQLPDQQGPLWSHIVQSEPSNERIIYGDLWPAGILLDTTTHTVVILDWECTRMGNDFEDLTQLLANLYLMSEGTPFHRPTAADLMTRVARRIPKQSGRRVEADFLYTLLTLKDYPHWGLDDKEAVVAQACRDDSVVMRALRERGVGSG
jgi:aminoglycoside phosphotransferase (APT) family kinase protein